MKLQRIFMLGLIATSMALITSCSDGEDGTDGIDGATGPAGAVGPAGAAGADGTDGVDGTDGTDGTNGVDGNANVRRLIIDTSLEPGNGANPVVFNAQFSSLLAELTPEVLDTHAILTYAKTASDLYIPIPGPYTDGAFLYSFGVAFSDARATFFEYNGVGWTDDFAEIHLVLIEQSSSVGDGGGGQQVKAPVDALASLKAANVDVSNYHEVVKYFDID